MGDRSDSGQIRVNLRVLARAAEGFAADAEGVGHWRQAQSWLETAIFLAGVAEWPALPVQLRITLGDGPNKRRALRDRPPSF